MRAWLDEIAAVAARARAARARDAATVSPGAAEPARDGDAALGVPARRASSRRRSTGAPSPTSSITASPMPRPRRSRSSRCPPMPSLRGDAQRAAAHRASAMPPAATVAFAELAAGGGAPGATRHGRRHLADALYLRHDRPAQGRAAPPSCRTRGGARACRAEPLRARRAHAWRHAALSHDGRALAARDGAGRWLLRLPAPLRRARSARPHRARAGDHSLSRADALSRSAGSDGFARRRSFGLPQARLCRRRHARRAAASRRCRRSRPTCSSIITARPRSTPSRSSRTRRESRARRARPGSTSASASCSSGRPIRRRAARRARKARSSPISPSDEAFEGYWRRPDADARALHGGWYFTGDTGYFDGNGDLFVTGRVDDMIITGGENISPAEIESVLSLHAGRGRGRGRRPCRRALGPARHGLRQAATDRGGRRRSMRIAAPRASPISSGRAPTCSSPRSRNRRSARSCAACSSRASTRVKARKPMTPMTSRNVPGARRIPRRVGRSRRARRHHP